MTEKELIELRDGAEVTKIQFKERVLDKYDIACELVAFSNSRGGKIIVGINDKTGNINPLSFVEIQETTNLLTNLASENVFPNILISIDTVKVDGGQVVIATIPEGKNKPYHDNKGIVWVKNGSDKRRVFDNAELAEMMTECGSFHPDEAAVNDSSIDDLDIETVKLFLLGRFASRFENVGLSEVDLRKQPIEELVDIIGEGFTLEKLFRNLRFIRPDGKLTVAAMLLFGKAPQRWLPVLTTKCVSFYGNDESGMTFRDKVDGEAMEGNLLHQFSCVMDFFRRNLRMVQDGEEFNQQGKIEIPIIALQELVVNSMVHRSLVRQCPIRIFIFDDRVEIHSPGTLPGGLTVKDIEAGTSLPRNNYLFSNAIFSLPYAGIGTGIRRCISLGIKPEFKNDENLNEFVIIIPRLDENGNQVTKSDEKSNQVQDENGNQVTKSDEESNQVQGENSNQVTKSDEESNQVKGEKELSHPKLTKQQEDIRNFCSIPRTAQEIMDRLGITNQSKNRQRHIQPLLDMGVLEMTNPENPTANNQKYRRTPKK